MFSIGEYIILIEKRDSLSFSPDMSKRARAVELWATMKYLDKNGINELVRTLHHRSVQLAEGLSAAQFIICNDIVFNQVLVRLNTDKATKELETPVQILVKRG